MPLKSNFADTLRNTIRDLVAEYGQHPYDINDGNCETFAMDVHERHPKVEYFWGDELLKMFPPSVDCSCHCFLKFQNRYYDAEEPEGVLHPIFLPFFFRTANKEEVAWAFDWLAKHT
jgi:hypothetical protein